MNGKFIFVSGLSGAGKSTLVDAALDAIENTDTVVTYVTRPPRPGEESSREHVFMDDEEYERLKAASDNWDETIYAGYKYGADGAKYMRELANGTSVIVAVAPDMNIIQATAGKYGVKPVTIWIDTSEDTAASRISSDAERSARVESEGMKENFDIIFRPTGDISADKESFVELVRGVINS